MEIKGSYTVEAALIMSILIPLLSAVIYLGFYVHNKAVLQEAACRIVSTGSLNQTEGRASQAMEEIKQDVLGSRLIGMSGVQGDVSEGSTLNASFSGSFYVPGLVMRFFCGNRMEITVNKSMKSVQPVKTLQKIRSIEKLLDR